ncbi:11301_t:CDS:2, partial [Diversispora eburnea]
KQDKQQEKQQQDKNNNCERNSNKTRMAIVKETRILDYSEDHTEDYIEDYVKDYTEDHIYIFNNENIQNITITSSSKKRISEIYQHNIFEINE